MFYRLAQLHLLSPSEFSPSNNAIYARALQAPLASQSPSQILHLIPRTQSPNQPSSEELVRIIGEAVQRREWDHVTGASPLPLSASRLSPRRTPSGIGIAAVQNQMESQRREVDQTIKTAFDDLAKLMDKVWHLLVRHEEKNIRSIPDAIIISLIPDSTVNSPNSCVLQAKEMVTLANSISKRLRESSEAGASGGSMSDDETTRFKQYLLGLGVEEPVSRDAFKSRTQYYVELARELSRVLLMPIQVYSIACSIQYAVRSRTQNSGGMAILALLRIQLQVLMFHDARRNGVAFSRSSMPIASSVALAASWSVHRTCLTSITFNAIISRIIC